ncbi:type 4b pilus protein PilO2 [Acerihabitans arboris]|uniref:Type 4b pilus protein PilO2 n=1 Tax=Acerihabitans arboris TaxID=2691583 RepID=A0A845SM39_9GAMM|nr:type 4b pilus protein PilO2 [Acerihabitans arboris]NDL64287.1 type 4b pilus protein PilO2 [Acerihabitans arboris]
MKQPKRTAPQESLSVLVIRRTGWVVGLRWVEAADTRIRLRRNNLGDTHRVQVGRKPGRMTGFARPTKVKRGVRLCSLAAAFLEREGGNSYGVYQLDEQDDRWLFLATARGRLSVMGDVVGPLREVEAARERFLEFNEPGDTQAGWHDSATPEQALSWQVLTRGLTRAQRRRVQLREIPSVTNVGILALLMVSLVAALFNWRDDAALTAQQAAALAAFRARQAVTVDKPAVRASHPWATLPPSSTFLSQCWFTREPLPVSVAGWRLTAGECTLDGLRLRYVATAGSTVEDFAKRSKELLGQNAGFDLTEGGQNGDVYIPFLTSRSPVRDEVVPAKDPQLMRFVSHLQRRNIRVQFTEVKPPQAAPGAANAPLPQDWREFTFSVNARLAPEWLLAGCDDTGLRLTSIAFTLSPQGQFDYTIKGSLYAQR